MRAFHPAVIKWPRQDKWVQESGLEYMNEVFGIDLQNPVLYLLANNVVWMITVGSVQSIFFDGNC